MSTPHRQTRQRLTPDGRELAATVAELHAGAVPWLPCGRGSRLGWGPPVRDTDVELSCAGLRGIVQHAWEDFTVTVEAGLPLAELHGALAERGQWLALDDPWGSGDASAGSGSSGMGSGSVGGLVARGLSGGLSHRYMGVRDRLIGIALLRSDGTAARAGGRVVKNVAGYDLMRLLCGSWGSLALITEVTLRTYPIPPLRRTALLQGPLPALDDLRRWLLGTSLTPEAIDWRRRADGQTHLRLRLASVSAEAVAAQWQAIAGQAAALGLETSEAAADGEGDGAGRETSLPADGWLLRLAVPASRARELLQTPVLRDWHLELGGAGGLGDAWRPHGRVDQAQALRDRIEALGGHATVLVQPSPARLPAWRDAPSRPLIEAVKRQFDPLQQLARGRLPGVAPALTPQR